MSSSFPVGGGVGAGGSGSEGSIHRIFVVGCPRSGTTLAQTLVASHRDLVTFPETHFFTDLPSRWRIGRLIGLASSEGRRRLERVASTLELDVTASRWPVSTSSHLTQKFVRLLDIHASRHDARGWVEKTPFHLRRIGLIEEHVPRARFCHVLRRGPDVVASLFAVTHRHPEGWGGARSLDRCIRRWLDDVQVSLSYRDQPGHVCVRYEELTEEPEARTRELWSALGLSPVPFEKDEFERAGRKALPNDAPWQSVGEDVEDARSSTFREVFAPSQRERVLERLREEGRARGLYWNEEPLFE